MLDLPKVGWVNVGKEKTHPYPPTPSIARSNSPARERPISGNSGDFVEAVFRVENFRIFPMISCRILRDPVVGIFDLGISFITY